jgi:aspartyl-tRNA(Asn)/glutamyl-tRNA(Gln) amidotransferase subunit B
VSDFETVIGLECHVQLLTRSKAFSPASAAFGDEPNSHTDPYTLALPGTLPVLNAAAVELVLRLGIASGCTIRRASRFARKHYFYPDLPKGYQISQYEEPVAEGGALSFWVDDELRTVRLIRIHMEEDAGKSTHAAGASYSLVDLNRAGVALAEVVTEPELRSAREAAECLRGLRQLVRYLGVCDGNMEEGSLRCDANVSVRPAGETRLGTRVELKNLNSFRFLEQAIDYEAARQVRLIQGGGRVVQETRLWDPEHGASYPMRSKEQADDYRYFPDPDLPPLVIDEDTIARIANSLPETPAARRARFVDALGLPAEDAALLTSEREIADYYEATLAAGASARRAANWITGELLRELKQTDRSIAQSKVTPVALAELLRFVEDDTISARIAKGVFQTMWNSGRSAADVVQSEGLTQVTDEAALEVVIREVLAQNPKQLEKLRAGDQKLHGFFMGQVMKRTEGRASPQLLDRLLRKLIGA